MKYKQNIIFENESTKTELVDKYKDDIIEKIRYLIEANFDFNITLIVKIVDIQLSQNYVNKETTCGYSSWQKNGNFIVCFGIESLERVERDNGLDIAISIYHELGHVYDMYHVMHNKYYKINPLYKRQRNLNNYIIQQGWNFWTEFYAYFCTFKEFGGLHNYPTFYQIVRGYEQLTKQYKILEQKLDDKTKEKEDLAKKQVESTEQFIYALAKHLAGCVMGKPRYYKMKVNNKNEKLVKLIEKISLKTYKLISKIFSNT